MFVCVCVVGVCVRLFVFRISAQDEVADDLVRLGSYRSGCRADDACSSFGHVLGTSKF